MKLFVSKIVLTLFCTFLLFAKCNNKKDAYSSVNGVWRVDQYGDKFGHKSYNVSVNNHPYTKGIYVIYNLYSSGDQTETYFTIKDFEITLQGTSNIEYRFEGTGTAEADYKSMKLNFEVSTGSDAETVEAFFKR